MDTSYNHSVYNRKRRRKLWIRRIAALLAVIGLVCGLFFGVRAAYWGIRGLVDKSLGRETSAADSNEETEPVSTEEPTSPAVLHADVLRQAEHLALMYDYDGAIALIQDVKDYNLYPDLKKAVENYKDTRSKMTRIPTSEVHHIFFRSLVADPAKAFAQDSSYGYSRNHVTVEEFREILQQLYDNGFVLVSLQDVAGENAEGKFTEGNIRLPQGKKAVVLSVDMQYYEDMNKRGFPNRLVVRDGKVTCELRRDDGTLAYGAYDVVPVLEEFLEIHPDFSYKGAKGILALTGYDGIFGYRTAPKYADYHSAEWKDWYETLNVESEQRGARAVADALKEAGWQFAYNTYRLINLADYSLERIQQDMTLWLDEVGSIVGEPQILMFPFGADIGNWRNYAADNAKYQYFHSVGIRYFCTIDTYTIPWVQCNSDLAYLRQGRVNLDGGMLRTRAELVAEHFGINMEGRMDPNRPPVN